MTQKTTNKETKEQATESSTASDVDRNLRFYTQGREVPADALKDIKAGRLKGKSDVNPMWRLKRMTEIFGPCGIGWKYTIDRQWTEAYCNEVKCFCNVSLYVRDPETKEWSDAIPGNGGSSIVSQENNGAYVNDEGYKMALTDALSIAMKPLGIGADIWYPPKAQGHNESKYEQFTNGAAAQGQASQLVFTGAQLQQAVSEMQAVTTHQALELCWGRWQAAVPGLCQNGTEFYKAAIAKRKQLNAGRK